jgi:hypothetical protein
MTKNITTKKKKKTGKFGAKKTLLDGIKFDSIMESEYYTYLKEEKKAGRVKDFELQPVYVLQEAFIKVGDKVYVKSHSDYEKLKKQHKAKVTLGIKYISDYFVTYADGSQLVIDVKGQETADFKIKRKMFDLLYPHLTLKLVQKRGPKDNKYWADYDDIKAEIKEKKKKAKVANKKIKEA